MLKFAPLLAALFALASTASASNARVPGLMKELGDANCHRTPYEILKELYENADGPATLSDFPKYEDVVTGKAKAWQSTFVLTADSKRSENLRDDAYGKTMLFTLTHTVPGRPNNGPLFPGTADRVETEPVVAHCLLNLNCFQYTNGSGELETFAQKNHLHEGADDLVITVDEKNASKLRRVGDLIVAKEVVREGGQETLKGYWYLWQE